MDDFISVVNLPAAWQPIVPIRSDNGLGVVHRWIFQSLHLAMCGIKRKIQRSGANISEAMMGCQQQLIEYENMVAETANQKALPAGKGHYQGR